MLRASMSNCRLKWNKSRSLQKSCRNRSRRLTRTTKTSLNMLKSRSRGSNSLKNQYRTIRKSWASISPQLRISSRLNLLATSKETREKLDPIVATAWKTLVTTTILHLYLMHGRASWQVATNLPVLSQRTLPLLDHTGLSALSLLEMTTMKTPYIPTLQSSTRLTYMTSQPFSLHRRSRNRILKRGSSIYRARASHRTKSPLRSRPRKAVHDRAVYHRRRRSINLLCQSIWETTYLRGTARLGTTIQSISKSVK